MTLVCIVCGFQMREVKRMIPFPTELDKLKIWQQNMGLKQTEESFRNFRICNRHFEKDCFNFKSYRLRQGAIPTLFPRVPIHSPTEVPKGRINAPMEYIKVGSCFESYKELLSKLNEYCNATNSKFVKKDFRRVSAELTEVNQSLIYSELKFNCVHNGISTSKRKSRNSKLECPAYFSLKMIDSGTALQIIALNNNHNHPTEEKCKVTRQKQIAKDDDEVWRYGEPTEIVSKQNEIEIDNDEIWPFEEPIKSGTRQKVIETDYEFWQYQRPTKTLPKQILVDEERDDDEDLQLDGPTKPMPQHIKTDRDDDEPCQPTDTVVKQKGTESDNDESYQFEEPIKNMPQHIEIERDDYDESWQPTDSLAKQKEIESDDDELCQCNDPIKNHEVHAYKRKRPIIIEENVKRIRLQIERDIGYSDDVKQIEFIDLLIDQDSEPNVNFTFRGLCAPVFTVFNKDLTVNVEIIPKYAKFLADNGIKAVLVHGTSGEGMSMTVAERKSVTEEWIKAAKSTKQHVMVQVGGCPLPDVLELTKHAEAVGVDSLLCLPELYFKPSTPSQLISYLKIVGEAAPKTPLLYYHIPGWTGVNINMAQFLNESVGKIPTFHGIKYTSNDLDGGAAALRANDGKYAVFLGADTLLAGAFAMGFDSAIATSFNMLPQYGVQILEAIRESNVEKAQALQKKLSAACSVITKDGAWVPTMKVAMNVITPLNVGLARPPLTNLTVEEASDMERSLKAASLF